MNRGPSWIDPDHWICSNHMRSVRLPAAVSRCYYATCQTPRPDRKIRTARRVNALTKPSGTRACTADPNPSAESTPRSPSVAPPKEAEARLSSLLPHGPTVDPTAPNETTTSRLKPCVPGNNTSTSVSSRNSTEPTSDVELLASTVQVLECSQSGATTQTNQCDWHSCTRVARPRSKYCSRDCSNKNARARYKSRRVLH